MATLHSDSACDESQTSSRLIPSQKLNQLSHYAPKLGEKHGKDFSRSSSPGHNACLKSMPGEISKQDLTLKALYHVKLELTVAGT